MFLFSKNAPKLSYSNAEFKNLPGSISRTFVLGWGRKICSHSPKMYQNSPYSNAEFKKFLCDNTPDSRFRGEESWFKFSENVPTRSSNNAGLEKNPELLDPVFGMGRGKLPPLEIRSGYATATSTRFAACHVNITFQTASEVWNELNACSRDRCRLKYNQCTNTRALHVCWQLLTYVITNLPSRTRRSTIPTSNYAAPKAVDGDLLTCRLLSSRDLHGITDRGNRGITAVKTAVMGNGFPFLPR